MTMEVERMTRLELATYAMARRRSSQLSYIRLESGKRKNRLGWAMVGRIRAARNTSSIAENGP